MSNSELQPISYGSSSWWSINRKPHRVNGPAFENMDKKIFCWAVDGRYMGFKEWCKTVQPQPTPDDITNYKNKYNIIDGINTDVETITERMNNMSDECKKNLKNQNIYIISVQ